MAMASHGPRPLRRPIAERRQVMWRRRDYPWCTSLSTRNRFSSNAVPGTREINASELKLTRSVSSSSTGSKATPLGPGRPQPDRTQKKNRTMAGHPPNFGLSFPGKARSRLWMTREAGPSSGRPIFFPRDVRKPGSWFLDIKQQSQSTNLPGLSIRIAYLPIAGGWSTTCLGRGPWRDHFCLSVIPSEALLLKRCVFHTTRACYNIWGARAALC